MSYESGTIFFQNRLKTMAENTLRQLDMLKLLPRYPSKISTTQLKEQLEKQMDARPELKSNLINSTAN